MLHLLAGTGTVTRLPVQAVGAGGTGKGGIDVFPEQLDMPEMAVLQGKGVPAGAAGLPVSC